MQQIRGPYLSRRIDIGRLRHCQIDRLKAGRCSICALHELHSPTEDVVNLAYSDIARPFACRYSYLRTQRNGESLLDYTGTVNSRHEIAEFNDITPEQMKCLVWMWPCRGRRCRHPSSGRKMEDNPKTTLKELNSEILQRHDAKLLKGQPSSSPSAINFVNSFTEASTRRLEHRQMPQRRMKLTTLAASATNGKLQLTMNVYTEVLMQVQTTISSRLH